ncbi:MAG: carboxypeptidase-like regulatory domain-containing protein [Bacteroidia bacterium]
MRPSLLVFLGIVLYMMLPTFGIAQHSRALTLEDVVRQVAVEEDILLAYDPQKLSDIPAPTTLPKGKGIKRLNALLAPYFFEVSWTKAPRAMVVAVKPSLTGQVFDAETGEPLPFAKAEIPGKVASLSGPKGYFTLEPPYKANLYLVVVSYVGYASDTVLLQAGSRPKPIRLKVQAQMLAEVRIEDGLTQQLRVSDAASQASINPKTISTLSGLGEPDIFRASQLLPGIQASGLSSGGLHIRGASPDQTLTRFDGITAYRVDHFFGLFGAFNSRAVRQIDVYRGGYGAKFGGRASGVIDIEGRNGNFEKPHLELGMNLFNSSILVESPIIKNKVSLLVAARKSYTDVVESPFYRKFFSNVFSPPDAVALQSARQVRSSGSSSADFLDSYEEIRFDPASITNLGDSDNTSTLTRSPVDFRSVNRDYLRESSEPKFEFSDLNVRLSVRPSPKDLVTLSGFQGSDFLSYNYNDQPNLGLDVDIQDALKLQNRGSSLRWKRAWTPAFFSNTTFAYSEHTNEYQYRITARDDTSVAATELGQNHGIRDFSLRSDHSLQIGPDHKLSFGLEASRIRLRYGMAAGDTLFIGQRSIEATNTLYLEHAFSPLKNVQITTGMRNSWYSKTQSWYTAPRLQIRYNPDSPWSLKAAWGVYNQFISRIRINNGLGLGEDFFAFGGNEEIPVITSSHTILGAAWAHKGWLIDIEAYKKQTQGLSTYAFRSDLEEIDPDGNGEIITGGESLIKGIDVLIQKQTGNHTGWISYSLSHGFQRFASINKGVAFPSLLDQRHELKLVNQIRIKDWELAATWILASGRPYTEAHEQKTQSGVGGEPEAIDYEIVAGQRNAARLPAYHRLDLSATYHWKLGKAPMETGLSIYNAYYRVNIRQRRYVLINSRESGLPASVSQADVYDLGFSPNIFWKLRF